MEITTHTEKHECLKKYPLFFVKFRENIKYDEKAQEETDYSYWYSTDRDLGISFSAKGFGNRSLGYCLCIIDKADYVTNNDEIDNNNLKIQFHEASSSNPNDNELLLKSYITRFNDKEDKYSFMEILWLLDKQGININALKTAIQKFDNRYIPYILSILTNFSRCLSYNNQTAIKEVFSLCGGNYEIYMPDVFPHAYHLATKKEFSKNDNLFSIIDTIFSDDSISTLLKEKNLPRNPFVDILLWLEHEDKSLEDYNCLKTTFPFLSEYRRLLIVKRYMHDIRHKRTQLDSTLLNQFKDNEYDEYIRYRYCIEKPSEPIELTTPLLSDCLLTLNNSQGKSFQTYDGILDFAMTHCDKNHPNINLMLEKILPTCDYGAVYNSSFKGFIDYALIRRMNSNLMTDEKLQNSIKWILNTYCKHETYHTCKWGDGSKLSEEQLRLCQKGISTKKGDSIHLECLLSKKCEDRWIVNDQIKEFLDIITNEEGINQILDKNHIVSLEMLSLSKFKKFLLNIPNKESSKNSSYIKSLDDEEFLVKSYSKSDKNLTLKLMEDYSDILRMRIFPQEGAILGIDLFGYQKEEFSNLTEEDFQNKHNPVYQETLRRYHHKEAEELRRRTITSLKVELKDAIYNGSYYELSYDRQTLINVIHKYYFKNSYKETDNKYEHQFLTKSYVTSYFKPLCAPELSKTNNPAIDIPYFWCRNKECFHNNLGNQTLNEVSDWNKYTLYHMTEIIGYPQLRKTDAGYEPKPSAREFIAVTNKAMQKFRRLKCRSCGHLLFTDKSSGFNRYNYYSCINPSCSEAWKPIYLNICFQCKTGYIDSRDTKQCPNGWYICPTCLSCCNDEQYERLAQRYVLSNRPIPSRIQLKLGMGHNDKNLYFCYLCGNQIEQIEDGNNPITRICSQCKKVFEIEEPID